MKRFALVVLGTLAVLALMFFPALTFGSSTDTSPEFANITNYQATFAVDAEGTLTAHEKLTVDLPFGRHGIFRFFDVADVSDPNARLRPYAIRVTRDGASDGTEILSEGHGRYVVVKIGRAETTIDGSHVYDITYKIDGVLSARDGASQFYWNLIPSGWRMPIKQSTLTVSLPGDVGEVKCAIGVGADTGCTPRADGKGFTVTTGALAPNTPVTVQAPVAVPAPGRVTLPWSIRFDPVFGRSLVGAGVFGVLSLIGAVVGFAFARGVREPVPPFPLQYAPPDGLGPAQAAYLFTERVNKDAYPATLLDLASKGVISLDHGQKGWQIEGLPATNWSKVDEIGAETARTLGVDGRGGFTLDPSSTQVGQDLQAARSDFTASVKAWSRSKGLIEVKYLVALAGLFVVAAAVLAGLAFFWNPFSMSLLGLPFGLFAVQAAPVLDSRSQTIRTQAGRELWSRIGGFHRVLSTPPSVARFDFSGRKELYTAYIPWAVAFGCAEAWANKYRMETGEDPPSPSYVGGYYGGGYYGSPASAFADDFNTSVDSAISAYQASIAPQGGSGGGFGGGGFSGGGGGGGGGGGSW